MSLLTDLQEFVHDHRPHDGMTADATEPEPNGYRLTVASRAVSCSSGGSARRKRMRTSSAGRRGTDTTLRAAWEAVKRVDRAG